MLYAKNQIILRVWIRKDGLGWERRCDCHFVNMFKVKVALSSADVES